MLLGLFLVVLCFAILAIKFSLDLSLELDNHAFNYVLRLRLGPFFLAVPKKLTGKMDQIVEKGVSQNFEEIWRSLDRYFQELLVIKLDIELGLGDPYWTALAFGSLWAIVGSLITILSSTKRLKSAPELKIEPNYAESNLQVRFYCIFRFRLGQIIFNELKRLVEE